MDNATAWHLNTWLKNMVAERHRDEALTLIFLALDEYPDLIEKGRSWEEIKTVGERIQERKVA